MLQLKSLKIAFSVYTIVMIIALFLPTSSEYSTFFWKLIISQIYAIPALLITLLVYIVCRNNPYLEEVIEESTE